MPPAHGGSDFRSPGGRSPGVVETLMAGGLAGMIAKTVIAPLDRVKILSQVTSRPFKLRDLPVVVRSIVASEGVMGLWKGNSVMMIRVFPYAGVQFAVFDSLKSYFEKDGVKMSHSRSLLSGSTAGLISTFCTYPLDLARARMAVVKGRVGPGVATSLIANMIKKGEGELLSRG